MAMEQPKLAQVKLSRDHVERLQRHCDNDEQEESPIWRRPIIKDEKK